MADTTNGDDSGTGQNTGTIRFQEISTEMSTSYMDAMPVIVSRAVPDVRDGLKPVPRRIMNAMHDQGLNPGARFQKGAAIVGEVPKHYHPHGGVSVYHTMVRLAQPSNKRNPMASEQGTFGSQDGDSALAHRYTEARLAAPASELLADVEKETRQTQGVIIMLLDDEDTVGTIVGVGTGEEVEEEA